MAKARNETATVDIKIRMREPLRAEIEKAAADRGVSMNAEMVERLSESFRTDNALGGRRTAALLRSLAGLVEVCQGVGSPEHDDDWLDDRGQFNQVVDAWNRFLDEMRPPEAEQDRIQQQH